jgi:transposase
MKILESLKTNKTIIIAMKSLIDELVIDLDLVIEGTITEICKNANVNRTYIYQKKAELKNILEQIELSGPGRPIQSAHPSEQYTKEELELKVRVLYFRLDHPGSFIAHDGGHIGYSFGFKRFTLDLFDEWAGSIVRFCTLIKVPYQTFRSWKKLDLQQTYKPNQTKPISISNQSVNNDVKLIINNYSKWEGGLRDFVSCEARHLGLSKNQIYRALRITGMIKPQGSPAKISGKHVIEILHHSPRIFGINRSSWSCGSLAEVYEKKYGVSVSKSSISRYIRSEGYSFKKAREVLTSPDPNYREKVELLLSTLWSLETDELFFFIDELGPLRVKKYGGRCYIKKGETSNIPQNQPSKGSITLSAALSATTNQLSWNYGKSKDTSAMIDLIEILYNQYYEKSKLFITWDAASWHRSNELLDWLDIFNTETRHIGGGPIIEFIPLPTSSQFLNVIESIFSGMKRAVIHHSDYQTEEEMKSAISLHFADRNNFFRDNPKRAGKKIWDINFFKDYNNIKSGDYRKW